MEQWSARFKTTQDECEHLILGLLIAGSYEEQKQELVDSYGIDIIEVSYRVVINDYSSLLNRLL